jgi:hypothetical protein
MDGSSRTASSSSAAPIGDGEEVMLVIEAAETL